MQSNRRTGFSNRARSTRKFALLAKLLTAVLLLALLASGAPYRKRSTNPKISSVVRHWMRTMSLRDKVAQLIFIPFHGAFPSSQSSDYRKFVHLIRDVHVGGLILVNWSNGHLTKKAEPYALASFLNRMQRLSKIPLIVCGDFERGASMRVENTTEFPHAMAFGATFDPSLTRYEGEVTAREARALGIQWLFYPVADVNDNPDNPIINIRSFGENPQEVAKHVVAFIEGSRTNGKYRVLTTAKHFPGHGDTAVDTHLRLATINVDREHLENVELVPFKAAIKAGVDSIMTAHIAVPALAPPDVPATLSPAILTGLLRDQLGFRGLIVTDALEMGGIAKGYSVGEAAVKALQAGADALLMTPDPEAAQRAVLTAIHSGTLSRKRIDESVARILTAKVTVGLNRQRYVNVDAIADEVNSPETNERAQEIADRAVTLVRNEKKMLPLVNPAKTCFLVLTESRYSTRGQVFVKEVKRRVDSIQVTVLDPTMTGTPIEEAVQRASACDNIVVAAFASVAAYQDSTVLAGDYPKLLDSLVATGKPVALVALGNPYLLRSFPNVSAYLATFSTVPPSELAAVKAIFGEIPIRGRLPITIPGLAKYGDGIILSKYANGPPSVTIVQ